MLRKGVAKVFHQFGSPINRTVVRSSSTAPFRSHFETNNGSHFENFPGPIATEKLLNNNPYGQRKKRTNGFKRKEHKRGRGKDNFRSKDTGSSTNFRQAPLNSVIHNEEYIYNNFSIPKAADYGLVVEPIDNCSRILEEANLLSRKTIQQGRIYSSPYTQQCNYTIELDSDIVINAVGHGKTKSEAEANASLHAICILHDQKLFQSILPGGKYASAPEAILQSESDAKKDIIDYAARHDCLPVFSTHQGRSSLKKSMVTVTASIPELSLTGFGRAAAAPNALIQACISLKQAAEAHYEKTGDGLLLVKDYTTLTTGSSLKFVQYYSYVKRLRYDLSSVNVQKRDWISTVSIQGPEPVHSAFQNGSEDQSDQTATPRKFKGIVMASKRDSEDTACLSAALAIKKEDPDLWNSFVKEMKRGNGELLKALKPIDIGLSSEAMSVMRETTSVVKAMKNDKKVAEEGRDNSLTQSRTQPNFSRQISEDAILQKSQDLQDAWKQYQDNPALEELRRKRSELPMVQNRDKIMNLVNDNEVCVVVGATGSGKTTQLPQLILEEMIDAGQGGKCNIICTQPRRIAAISVAQRVAVERHESLQETIGYAVRFDSKMPKFGGSINYCTTGILLRQLQDNQDATLDGISHIIIDEVHERDIQIDFLLVILRQLMADRKAVGRPPIKVILMSATIDTNLFCKYFGAGYSDGRCPYIEVPGRTFPVTHHFLDELYPELKQTYSNSVASELHSRETQLYVNRELVNAEFTISMPVSRAQSVTGSNAEEDDDKAVINWKSKGAIGEDGEAELSMDKEDTMTPVGLMSIALAHILKTTTEGSILIFLPGFQEITALNRILTTTKPLGIDFSQSDTYKIYLLHSAIPQMQQEVFEKLENGKRKIILSTNIAETSITIPDVVYVLDSSKHRESQYDQIRRMSSLVSTWTSKSNARQRAGRAGRVQHGHYYSMASKMRYDSFEVAPQPEILRTDLQELCLQVKSMGIADIKKFLQKSIEPPPASSVEFSIEHLQALGALDEAENLTPLGRLLATLPVQPSLGKMAILGALFKCLDPILILAAASTSKDPFISPLDRRAEASSAKKRWAQNTGSDHVAIINAFKEWRRHRAQSPGQARQFAFDNFLHANTMASIAQIAEQILELMQKSHLVTGASRPSRGHRPFLSLYGTEAENENSSSLALQTALATAGFYPNIAIQTSVPRQLRTAHENAAVIHPNSLAAPRTADGSRYGRVAREDIMPYGTLYTFTQKTRADQHSISLRGVTKTSPLSVILFGGKLNIDGSCLQVDEWIPFYARSQEKYTTLGLVKVLNDYLETTFSRLGAATQRRLLSRSTEDGFLDLDQTRAPLISGVVRALDLCADAGSCDSWSSSARSSTTFARNANGRNTGGFGFPDASQAQPRSGRSDRAHSFKEAFKDLV